MPQVGASEAGVTTFGFYNCAVDDIWTGTFYSLPTPASTNAMRLVGGMFGALNAQMSPGSFVDGDAVLAGSTTVISGMGQFGAVALKSNTATNYGSGLILNGDLLMVAKNWGGPALYGPGTVNVGCGGHLVYPGLTATNVLYSSGAITIGQSTTACNGANGNSHGATLTPQCGLTINAANLSAAATTTIGGNTSLTSTSANGTFASAVSLTSGQPMTFSTQAGVVYYAAAATTSSTSFTLTTAYSGTTTTTATTTTQNAGFGDSAWVPGCGSIGTIGP